MKSALSLIQKQTVDSMSAHPFQTPQQQRSLVLTQAGDKWRVSIIPPQPNAEPDIPQQDEFDTADEALGYAARLAARLGWRVVDQTGRRSPAEIEAAIEYAASLDLSGDGSGAV